MMQLQKVITRGVLLFFLFLLFLLVGCAPVGKVFEALVATQVDGPESPPGNYCGKPPTAVCPGEKLKIEPSTINFGPTDTTKTITVTGKDTFMFPKIFLCKTPCNLNAGNINQWVEAGVFDGTPVIGTFLSGANGISKQLTLNRDDLMNGNNFILIYTCQGSGLCNNRKWVLQKFTVTFDQTATCTDGVKNGAETDVDCGGSCPTKCAVDKGCTADTDCVTTKCDQTTKKCVVSCSDGIKNQDETDIDCGGVCVQQGKTCASTGGCKVSTDCASHVCTATSYQFTSKFGSLGSLNGQFISPIGIAVDASGNVYVVDYGNNRIQKFSSTGQFISTWGSGGSGDGQFNQPTALSVDNSNNVYVADLINNRIQKFSSIGTFITKWGTPGSGDGQFNRPAGLAIDSNNNVYVADLINNRIQKFSSTGQFLSKWGTRGSGDGQFNGPVGIAIDGTGNVYVADQSNNRIQKFSSTGAFITKWGTRGTGDGQLDTIVGIAIDGTGNVYVADQSNNRIQKFSSTGQFISKLGSFGSGDGQFTHPVGIAIDTTSNVYVVDIGNHRIQKFSPGMGVCAAPSCTDGIKNGAETDVDCGGSCTTKCAVDKGCTGDTDCVTTKCDSTTKKCVEKCQGVTCPTGKKCDSATGTCVQCTGNADCSDGKICESATKTCVQCIGDTNCPAGKICDSSTKTCIECVDDTRCSSDKKCDTTTHTCVNKCQGVTCTGTTPMCNPPTGTCVQCTANTDCSSGQQCTNNQCTTVTVTPQCITHTISNAQNFVEKPLPPQCLNGQQCTMRSIPGGFVPGGYIPAIIQYRQFSDGRYILSGQPCDSVVTGITNGCPVVTGGINGDGAQMDIMMSLGNGCSIFDDVAGMTNKDAIAVRGVCRLEIC